MTGASKILTVSYGTFSCTLEGFDDPFNTMKAIAEYFRDLAAEDRYFGAEPPTPDAAMLHRIAEREIQRRVEAKIQDNGVILRAGDSAGAETAPVVHVPALGSAVTPAQAPTLAPTVAPVEAEADGEGVAARLQRIRARHAAQVHAGQAAAAVAPLEAAPPAVTEPYIEDQHAEEPVVEELAVEADVIEIPDQLVSILDAAENDAALAEVPAPVVADLTEDFADLPEMELVAEDFDLAQIAAPEEVALAAFEAETAEVELPEAAVPVAAEATLADTIEEEAEEEAEEEVLLASLAAEPVEIVDEVSEDDEVGMLDEAEVEADTEAGFEEAGFDEAAFLSQLNDLEAPVAAAPAAEPQVDDVAAIEADPMLIENVDQPEAEEFTPAEAAVAAPAEEAPQPQRARARVIRIRRADPVAPVVPAAEPAPAATVSALSDEAEAALQAELAALEAEIGGLNTPVAAEEAPLDSIEPEEAEEYVAAAPALDTPVEVARPAEDDSVNRLMAQANSEMGGEETRRRQSAIAHLKAAVAATAADRAPLGKNEAQRQEAYRNDLDRVVRPRRPVAEGSTPRPGQSLAENAQRPTPLVLVSAQRIDRAPDAPADAPAAAMPRVVMPVRPRRVTTAMLADEAFAEEALAKETLAHDAVAHDAVTEPQDLPEIRQMIENADQSAYGDDDLLAPGETGNVFADATSFQDFADQLGANALPDLLEAAAVYCAEVLQRPEFSRPLVMRQLAGLPGQSAAAREDYLRGFGTLLRQGRIAKVKRGMFALTDRSPYLAEARKQAS